MNKHQISNESNFRWLFWSIFLSGLEQSANTRTLQTAQQSHRINSKLSPHRWGQTVSIVHVGITLVFTLSWVNACDLLVACGLRYLSELSKCRSHSFSSKHADNSSKEVTECECTKCSEIVRVNSCTAYPIGAWLFLIFGGGNNVIAQNIMQACSQKKTIKHRADSSEEEQ